MNPRAYRRIQEARRYAGYTQIYHDLVSIWSQEQVWRSLLFALSLLTLLFALPLNSKQLESLDFIVGLVVLGGFVITATYLLLLIYLAFALSKNIVSEVPLLAVYILTAAPRPYTNKRGLGYTGIRHLMEVARIEQAASDWRGTFVSVIIVGTLTLTIALTPFIWRFGLDIALNPPATESTTPWSDYWLSEYLYRPLVGWQQEIAILLLILISIWLVATLFGNTRRFLASEPANRMVLMACADALAFLETRQLIDVSEFSFREKRAVAAHYGCRIVREEDASLADQLWMWGDEPSGQIWYLVAPVRHSRVGQAKLYGRKLRNRVSESLNTLAIRK